MDKQSIGIVGYGIVGQALHRGFEGYPVLYYDKYKNSSTLEEVAANSQFIFICLPTPMYEDEEGIDISIIEEAVEQIVKFTNGTDKVVVIKSTIIPGTTAMLAQKYPQTHFCFNPEYLTESNSVEDFLNAERTVVAGFNKQIVDQVADLYHQQFPNTKIIKTDPTTAEMAKYMANCYLAMKVIFAYEMAEYCQALNVAYKEVKSIVITDPRIYDSHLDIVGDCGFGGKCFPKDMVSLLGLGKKLKVDTSLLNTVWIKNKKIRKNHEWKAIDFAVSKKKT